MIHTLKAMPDPLSSGNVAEVLGMDRTAVSMIIKNGRMEAMCFPTRSGHNRRYLVTREALLRYLIANTSGDKAVLMESIAQAFPKSAALLPQPAKAPAAPRSTKPARSQQDAEQLDLFAPPVDSTSADPA